MKETYGAYFNNLILILLAVFLASCAVPTKSNKNDLRPKQAQIRNPGTIELPKVFESVWYREAERKSLLKAYTASGKLTIGDQEIEFKSDDGDFEISIEDVNTISWGVLPRDTYNDWSIIKYGEPEKIIGFKDGSKLGWGTDTDLIFSTLKYAVEVVGGHAPTTDSPFTSGWIDISMGGLVATDTNNLAINISLYNKSERDTWIKITFLKPDLSPACTVTRKVDAKDSSLFECSQKTIISGQFYPIYHSVFLDENLTELVEKSGTRMYFSREGIELLEKTQETLTVPQ